MSNSRLEIAEKLFDDYATNLNWYHPSLVDIFLCPLCLQPFTKDDIQSNSLTIEHIIPSALGGKFVTLTCSNCNSQSGTKLDAHLIERLRTADALAGKSTKPLNIRVQIGSGEFGADLYLASDKNPNIQIIGIPDISNPKLHKRAQDEFDENPQKLSIKGSLGYKEIPSRAAVLRIAYLLAFSYFGYGYILYDNLKQVREQILNPEHETDAIKAMVWINEVPKTNVLAFLKQPQDLQCFFAILELVSEQKHVIGVALPGPDPDSSTIYQRWNAASATLNENTKPMMDIFDFNASYLSDAEFKFLPARIWHSLAIINEKKP